LRAVRAPAADPDELVEASEAKERAELLLRAARTVTRESDKEELAEVLVEKLSAYLAAGKALSQALGGAKRSTSDKPKARLGTAPWYWLPALIWMRTVGFFAWLKILRELSSTKVVGEFITARLVPACVGTQHGPLLTVCVLIAGNCRDVSVALHGQLIQIAALAFSNADEDALKEVALCTAQTLLEQRIEIDQAMSGKMQSLADAAFKSKTLKDTSISLSLTLLCKLCASDSAAAELDPFIVNRIIQPWTSGTDLSKIRA
jgi:hypothetical protein